MNSFKIAMLVAVVFCLNYAECAAQGKSASGEHWKEL